MGMKTERKAQGRWSAEGSSVLPDSAHMVTVTVTWEVGLFFPFALPACAVVIAEGKLEVHGIRAGLQGL